MISSLKWTVLIRHIRHLLAARPHRGRGSCGGCWSWGRCIVSTRHIDRVVPDDRHLQIGIGLPFLLGDRLLDESIIPELIPTMLVLDQHQVEVVVLLPPVDPVLIDEVGFQFYSDHGFF